MKIEFDFAVDDDGTWLPVHRFTVTAEEGIPAEMLEALKRAAYRYGP